MTGWAAPPPAPGGQISVEAGLGHEQHSSPLMRVSPDGTQLFVAGLNRLASDYGQLALSGVRDWPVGDEARLAVSGHALWKRSPTAPDLAFGTLSGNLAWRWPRLGGSLGIGPDIQKVDVAGAPFRRAGSLHGDLTWADADGNASGGGGFTVLMADVARNRHAPEFADFDSRTTIVSAHRHVGAGLPLVDALDLELGSWRERNAQGFADLSSRGEYARVSADVRRGAWTASVGYARHRVRFDAALLDTQPARRDRIGTVELALQWAWSAEATLSLELTQARNRANLDLYENRFRQAGVTLSLGW